MRVRPAARPSDRGQATVELALLLPVVALMLLGVLQVAVLAHRQVLLVHTSREAARAAAVVDGEGAASLAAEIAAARGANLEPSRVTVETSVEGHLVVVTVHYRDSTSIPLVGALLGDVQLSARAAMVRERSVVDGSASGTVQRGRTGAG